MPDYANNPAFWAASSRVTLCRVAWDDSYRDVVYFDTSAARIAFFDSLDSESIEIDHMTYLKPNEPITVNLPYNAVYTFNYLIVNNPRQEVPGEVDPPTLYYFIQGAQYIAPNTTQLVLSLDCFQTYLFKFRFGNCFVERGHIALAALKTSIDRGNAFGWSLRRYGTAAEGLDIGNEYIIGQKLFFDLSDKGWSVLIMSSTNLAADWGSKDNPNLETADGQFTDGIGSGCNVYAMNYRAFKVFCEDIKAAPWVAKGIQCMMAFPKTVLTDGPEITIGSVVCNFLGTTPDEGHYYTDSQTVKNRFVGFLDSRYKNLYKLCTYPYSVIEMTNYQGNSLILKPELIDNDKLTINQVAMAAPSFARIAFYPDSYGGNISGTVADYEYQVIDNTDNRRTGHLPAGNWVDNAIWFQSFPTMSIVNDEYTNYLASNANRLRYSYDSAGWTQQKSLASNQLTYDQANQALATNQANKNIQNVADVATGALGAIGSLASGNIGGALSGAAGSAIGLVSSNMQFGNTQQQGYQFAQQNKNLADWAARGDYQNQIEGINATVQDAALTQPSQSGQMGGDGFNLANGLMIVEMRFKQCDAQHISIAGEYFLRYGYAVREFMTPPRNLKACEKFTYWKFSESYLICSEADESVKNTIRGIFEKGVTVWNDPNDIGQIDIADNKPLEISY